MIDGLAIPGKVDSTFSGANRMHLRKLFVIAAFKPATTMNPEAAARYKANRLTVTLQLRYSARNRLPVVAPSGTRGLRPRLSAHCRQLISVMVKPPQKFHHPV